MTFAGFYLDTLLLSGGGLMVVDGDSKQVLKITVKGKYCCTGIELNRLFSGLAKLFSIPKHQMETDKSQKEADERYGECVGTVIGTHSG